MLRSIFPGGDSPLSMILICVAGSIFEFPTIDGGLLSALIARLLLMALLYHALYSAVATKTWGDCLPYFYERKCKVRGSIATTLDKTRREITINAAPLHK